VRTLEGGYDALLCGAGGQTPRAKRLAGQGGRVRQGKARNLIDGLRDRACEVLGFIHDFRIPFGNNEAERSFRMAGAGQKISGCFRSFEGAERFCRIRSYVATVRKNKEPVLDWIVRALLGDPFLPTGS